MAFVAWCRARYLTPGIDEETREDRNARFGASDKTPEWAVPDGGQYLLDWFLDLTAGHNRIVGTQAKKIAWSEMLAWRDATGNIVYPHEFAILRAMDDAFCEAINDEISYNSAKARDAAKAEAEAARLAAGKR